MRLRNRRIMAKRLLLFLWIISFPFYSIGSGSAQEDASRIRVSVVLVQLNVAVTDGKGNYISGLSPEDFTIVEDKIPEKTATFEEGNEPPRRLIDLAPGGGRIQTQNVGKTSEPTDTAASGDSAKAPAL